jgi:hypothetical protein
MFMKMVVVVDSLPVTKAFFLERNCNIPMCLTPKWQGIPVPVLYGTTVLEEP